MTASTRSTSGPPEKSTYATARNHATALNAILMTAGWTPDAVRKAAVNELVSLKPTTSPIFVTDGAGFLRDAPARGPHLQIHPALKEDFADLGAFEGQAVVGRSRLHLRRATEDNSLAGTPSSFALISQSTA